MADSEQFNDGYRDSGPFASDITLANYDVDDGIDQVLMEVVPSHDYVMARPQRVLSPRRVAVAAARSNLPVKRKPPSRVVALAPTPVNRNKIGVRNKRVGYFGEDLAAQFLCARHYEIVARNWSCMAGEADIVARDGESLVFVEVKTRTNIEKGLPSDAVDERKRRKYEKIATLFTERLQVDSLDVRFDVISVLLGDGTALIRHHIDAFGVA